MKCVCGGGGGGGELHSDLNLTMARNLKHTLDVMFSDIYPMS